MDTIYPIITNVDELLPFYITGVGCQKNQEYIHRPYGFMDYQWAYCRAGEGIIEIDGKQCTITQKSGFFFRARVAHKYYAVKKPWEVKWVTFNGGALPSLMDYLGFGKWETVSLLNIEYFDKVMESVFAILKSGKRFYAAECSLQLYNFLLRMSSIIHAQRAERNPESPLMLEPVIDFMESNYSSSITLPEIAGVISVTPSHLCRIFRKQYNMSVFKFLTNLRIQKSKQLLTMFTDMPIKEIAERVGFNDTSYFCMVFKKLEGITPTEFRGV